VTGIHLSKLNNLISVLFLEIGTHNEYNKIDINGGNAIKAG
jgi:hypothetical protein